MNVDVQVKRTRHFKCPNGCEHEFNIEHLFDRPHSAGPWYCDVCGQGWMVNSFDDGRVDAVAWHGTGDRDDGKMRRQMVVLEIPPLPHPIRLKVRGRRFTANIDEESHRYFYEEHTCAVNYFRDVEGIEIDGDEDPHGLARLVSVYDVDAEPEAKSPPQLGTGA